MVNEINMAMSGGTNAHMKEAVGISASGLCLTRYEFDDSGEGSLRHHAVRCGASDLQIPPRKTW